MMKRLLVVCSLIVTLFVLAACARSEMSGTAGGYAPAEPAMFDGFDGGGGDYDMAEGEEYYFEEEAAREDAGAVAQNSAAGSVDVQVQERLIIRTGYLSISSDDTLATRDAVEALVNQYAQDGAFVVTVEQYGGTDEGNPNIEMSIRVPSTQFNTVMDAIDGMGVDVYSRSESGQDVTEEYVDLSARLESLEAARERLLVLIEQAETTEALLQAEAQLTQREQEIEALKGRLQYLQESATLSSISVSISPTRLSQPIDTRWRPAETLREAFSRLVDSIRDFADFAIIFMISVLPWLVLFGGFVYLIIRGFMWVIRRLRGNGKKTHVSQGNGGDDDI